MLLKAPSEREPKVLDKSLFIFSLQSRKSAFRRANNEITEGLPSGGALVCGEHWQALGYEVSRAYKRRFTPIYRCLPANLKLFHSLGTIRA